MTGQENLTKVDLGLVWTVQKFLEDSTPGDTFMNVTSKLGTDSKS